jgi:hypothetical protein
MKTIENQFSYMKTGFLYSHYTGTDRQQILDCFKLAEIELNEGNTAEALNWIKLGRKHANILSKKMYYLDSINLKNKT